MPRPRRGQELLQGQGEGKRKDAGFLNARGHILTGSLQLRDSQMRVHTEHGWRMAGLQVNGHKWDSAKCTGGMELALARCSSWNQRWVRERPRAQSEHV